MVPGDSLGASWGLLGPWGARKGGFRGGDPSALGPAYALRGILTYMALRAAYGLSEDPGLTTCFFPGRAGLGEGNTIGRP